MNSDAYLVRYGTVPEVARFSFPSATDTLLPRAARVVVQTHRGPQLGTVLEQVRTRSATDEDSDFTILRVATTADERIARSLSERCETEFALWLERIVDWQLTLELIDLEWTLDGSKLILYVLTGRGPDTTNLALQAAAAGLGIIEVQPVSAEGLVAIPTSSGGGCGSGGCGCHS